jgi:hypothetical protein
LISQRKRKIKRICFIHNMPSLRLRGFTLKNYLMRCIYTYRIFPGIMFGNACYFERNSSYEFYKEFHSLYTFHVVLSAMDPYCLLKIQYCGYNYVLITVLQHFKSRWKPAEIFSLRGKLNFTQLTRNSVSSASEKQFTSAKLRHNYKTRNLQNMWRNNLKQFYFDCHKTCLDHYHFFFYFYGLGSLVCSHSELITAILWLQYEQKTRRN